MAGSGMIQMTGSRIFTYLGFFILLVAIPCPATTWTVDDDGLADFCSIQDAIDMRGG